MKRRLKKGDKIPFTQVANDILSSDNLSFKAKGLYAYMLSKPDNWNFTIRSMSTQLKDGQRSIRTGLNELREIGLISYIKHNNGTGEYSIYSNIVLPDVENVNEGTDPELRNPNVENVNMAKRNRINNKDSFNNKDFKNSHNDLNEEKSDECENSHETNRAGIAMILANLTKKTAI